MSRGGRTALRLAMGLLASGLTMACGPQPAHPKVAETLMARADLDGSDAVERAEFEQLAFSSEGFGTYDLDGSGALDAVELEQAFLTTSPSDFQDEGRIEVHRKYGHPFERPGGRVKGRGPSKGKGKGKRGKGGKRGKAGKAPHGKAPHGKAPHGKRSGKAPPPGRE